MSCQLRSAAAIVTVLAACLSTPSGSAGRGGAWPLAGIRAQAAAGPITGSQAPAESDWAFVIAYLSRVVTVDQNGQNETVLWQEDENHFANSLSVSADNRLIVYTRPTRFYGSETDNGAVWLYHFETGLREKLVDLWIPTWARWLPGSSAEFLYSGGGFSNQTIYKFNTETRQSELWASGINSPFVQWDANLRQLVFVDMNWSGVGGYEALPDPVDPAQRLTNGISVGYRNFAGHYFWKVSAPSITRDGTSAYMLFDTGEGRMLGRYDFATRTRHEVAFLPMIQVHLFNQDQELLFTGGTASGGNELVTCTLTGADCRQLFETPENIVVLDVAQPRADSTAPVLMLPPNQPAEADGPSGATVMWPPATAVDETDGPVPVTCVPMSGSRFPLGTTPVTCEATDAAGNRAAGQFLVTVNDTTPPAIGAVAASPCILWPPNHKLVRVTLSVASTDLVGPLPTCRITGVSSNEPQNGLGDGDTPQDWLLGSSLALQLRAERGGGGNGRVYAVEVTCTDARSNSASATTAITVPKSAK